MLSYIGGLFGVIAVVFGFVMKYYGQCCLQLEMCQKIFKYENDKKKKKDKSVQGHKDDSYSEMIIIDNVNNNMDGWIV